MEKDWTLVYTVDQSYKAQLVQEILEENEITGVVINKKDTSYTTFGEFEVYVKAPDSVKAREILQNSGI